MKKLKITTDNNESVVVGTDELSSLLFTLVISEHEPSPSMRANGYILKNETLDSRLEWTLPEITTAGSIRIEIEPSENAVAPTETDKREGYRVKEEKLYIKQQINKVKRSNLLLQTKIKEVTEIVGPNEEKFCVFCGSTESECRVLVTGPAANICNVCVGFCQEAIEKKLNA